MYYKKTKHANIILALLVCLMLTLPFSACASNANVPSDNEGLKEAEVEKEEPTPVFSNTVDIAIETPED
ncbi:MAG: hypothetical protein LBG97_02585 [Coriobacteriales bacterium]|jgi:biopolymer transport protein ExbD|nr:hypothetical protein [Coriobacteriales bacterium]